MNPLRHRCLIFILSCVSPCLAFAAESRSVVITTTTGALSFSIADHHIVRIHNFTQAGGGNTRGVVQATVNTGTTNVLAATLIDPLTTPAPTATPSPSPTPTPTPSPTPPPPQLEVINDVIISGPATITVNPVAGATLFITYKKEQESD